MTIVAHETTAPFDLDTAPMRIGRARLKVRDRERVAGFYRDVLGLRTVADGEDVTTLGAPDTALLDLVGDPAHEPGRRTDAGLFHLAFLLPGRAHLGRWLAFALGNGVALQGASDHRVSEALYLADPEGNGIEIYADRPPSAWQTDGETVEMATDPLDSDDLLAAADGGEWAGMPEGARLGHLHLQVGDTGAAERFYRDLLGFAVTCRYPGASFFGAGGYHHQLAANTWNSRGAAPRRADSAGLDGFELIVRDAARLAEIAARAADAGSAVEAGEGGVALRDPSGVSVHLRPG